MSVAAAATTVTVAEETRAAVRERPFLYDALAAGAVNYAAAAEALGLDADPDAVATALRRFAAELDAEEEPPAPDEDADARVTMRRGLGRREDGGDSGGDASGGDEPLLSVAGTAYAEGAGDATAVLARGDLDTAALERVLGRLRTAGVAPEAAGATPGGLVVVVGRREGADALRAVEAVLDG